MWGNPSLPSKEEVLYLCLSTCSWYVDEWDRRFEFPRFNKCARSSPALTIKVRHPKTYWRSCSGSRTAFRGLIKPHISVVCDGVMAATCKYQGGASQPGGGFETQRPTPAGRREGLSRKTYSQHMNTSPGGKGRKLTRELRWDVLSTLCQQQY